MSNFELNGTVLTAWPGAAGEVVIPESVTEIGLCAFAGCPCGEQPEIKRIIEQKTKSSEEEIPG